MQGDYKRDVDVDINIDLDEDDVILPSSSLDIIDIDFTDADIVDSVDIEAEYTVLDNIDEDIDIYIDVEEEPNDRFAFMESSSEEPNVGNSSVFLDNDFLSDEENAIAIRASRETKLANQIKEGLASYEVLHGVMKSIIVTSGNSTNNNDELRISLIRHLISAYGDSYTDPILYKMKEYLENSLTDEEIMEQMELDVKDPILLQQIKRDLPEFRSRVMSYMGNIENDTTYRLNTHKEIVSRFVYNQDEFKILRELANSPEEIYIITNLIKSDDEIIEFTCSYCEEPVEGYNSPLSSPLLAITVVKEKQYVVCIPQKCNKCGKIHVISKRTQEILTKSTHPYAPGVTALTKVTGNEYALYVPPSSSLIPLLSRLVSVVDKDVSLDIKDLDLDDDDDITLDLEVTPKETSNDEESDMVYFDWDEESTRFMELITMIHDSKSKLVSNSINNVAKVIGNQYGIYETTKLNALASLITSLERDLGFKALAWDNVKRLETLSKVDKDKLMHKDNANYVNDVLNSAVYRNGEFDKKMFDESFDNLLNYEKSLNNLLKELESLKYVLSYTPITSLALTQDLIQRYFYDDRLVKFLDEVSDLMILNKYSEDVYKNLGVVTVKKGESKLRLATKLQNAKRMLRGDKTFKMATPFSTIFETFNVNSYSDMSSVVPMFFDAKEEIYKMYDFFDASSKLDIYRMATIAKHLKVQGFINRPLADEIMPIYNCIIECPNLVTPYTKYDFYFRNIEVPMDASYQNKMLSIFESKGYILRKYVGETPDEIVKYYEEYDGYEFDYSYIDDNGFRDYVSRFSKLLVIGKYLDATEFNKTYLAYLVVRDALYSSAKLGVDSVTYALNLEPMMIASLIDDDFELPLPNDKLYPKDTKILAIPSLDILDIDNDEDIGPSKFTQYVKVLEQNSETIIEVLGHLGIK